MLEKLKFVASGMWVFLRPLIMLFMSKMGPVLAAAAMSAVKATADNLTGATNEEKRNNAYKLIVADLEKQSIQVGTDVAVSAVNAAIEAAYQKLVSN